MTKPCTPLSRRIVREQWQGKKSLYIFSKDAIFSNIFGQRLIESPEVESRDTEGQLNLFKAAHVTPKSAPQSPNWPLSDNGSCIRHGLRSSPVCTHTHREAFFLVGLGFDLTARKAGALPLEPHLQSILFWLFWRWGVSRTICPGWPQTMILPISASQVARITSVSHWRPAYFYFYVFMYYYSTYFHRLHMN
jgi:hypothetical protein